MSRLPDLEFSEYFPDRNESEHNVSASQVLDATIGRRVRLSRAFTRNGKKRRLVLAATEMTDKTSPERYDDEALWDGASTLEPEATKDAKVHVTLRIDPELYKALLKYKQDSGARTTTQALESVLRTGLDSGNDRDQLAATIAAMALGISKHTSLQDQLIQHLCDLLQSNDASRELWKDSVQLQTMLRQWATLITSDNGAATFRLNGQDVR